MELSRHVTKVQIKYIIMQRDDIITFPNDKNDQVIQDWQSQKQGINCIPSPSPSLGWEKNIIFHGHVWPSVKPQVVLT